MDLFRDRRHAGLCLAQRLLEEPALKGQTDLLIVGLPRGGVPVAAIVAAQLGATLDVLIVRKLGVPGQEELAMGAVASGGIRVLHQDVVASLGITELEIEAATRREEREVIRRDVTYRAGRAPAEMRGRYVVVVDDGLATGSTMRAAIEALRRQQPQAIMVAVPVAPLATCRELAAVADAVVCLCTPASFWGVGQWYADFRQTTDAEVCELLQTTRRAPSPCLDAGLSPSRSAEFTENT